MLETIEKKKKQSYELSHKVYPVYLASGKTDSRQLVVKNNILEMDNT